MSVPDELVKVAAERLHEAAKGYRVGLTPEGYEHQARAVLEAAAETSHAGGQWGVFYTHDCPQGHEQRIPSQKQAMPCPWCLADRARRTREAADTLAAAADVALVNGHLGALARDALSVALAAYRRLP